MVSFNGDRHITSRLFPLRQRTYNRTHVPSIRRNKHLSLPGLSGLRPHGDSFLIGNRAEGVFRSIRLEEGRPVRWRLCTEAAELSPSVREILHSLRLVQGVTRMR